MVINIQCLISSGANPQIDPELNQNWTPNPFQATNVKPRSAAVAFIWVSPMKYTLELGQTVVCFPVTMDVHSYANTWAWCSFSNCEWEGGQRWVSRCSESQCNNNNPLSDIVAFCLYLLLIFTVLLSVCYH